jgi:uncharacterized protein YeeX (DUF496 family)
MSDLTVIAVCSLGIVWSIYEIVRLERLKRRVTRDIAELTRRFEEGA